MMRDPAKTIGNLIDKQSVTYLGSVDGEGFPGVKALLAPRKREGLHTFWFTTNTSARRTAGFRENPKACVYFCDRRFFRGVQFTGRIEVCEDDETKQMIWQAGDTQYYAGGVTDPDYCVLKFTAYAGRFYSSFHSEDFEIDE